MCPFRRPSCTFAKSLTSPMWATKSERRQLRASSSSNCQRSKGCQTMRCRVRRASRLSSWYTLRLELALEASRIQTVTSSILAAAADAQDSGSSSSSSEVDDPDQDTAAAPLEDLASLPPRQPRPDEPSDALARRKAILAAYGSVEDDLADDPRAAAAAAKLSAEKDAAARDLMISDRIKVRPPYLMPLGLVRAVP